MLGIRLFCLQKEKKLLLEIKKRIKIKKNILDGEHQDPLTMTLVDRIPAETLVAFASTRTQGIDTSGVAMTVAIV